MENPSISTEQVIEQAKRELQRMIDTNPDIMLLVDASGTVARTNQALLEALGLSSYADAIGKPMLELLACEQADLLGQLLRDEAENLSLEAEAGMADGEHHILEFASIKSGPDLWVVMVRDVTDDKSRAAEEEKTHKREAVQALAGALMHHANQALTVIMVTANLLQIELEKGDIADNRLKTALQTIMDNATEVSRLLRSAENPSDYVTETYMEGLDILDLKRSSGES